MSKKQGEVMFKFYFNAITHSKDINHAFHALFYASGARALNDDDYFVLVNLYRIKGLNK